MKIKNKHKIIVYFLSGALTIFLVGKFLVLGLYGRLKTIRRDIVFAQSELKNNVRIAKTKDKFLRDYEHYRSYLKVSGANSEQIISLLLKETEGIVRASGGSVLNLNPDKQPEQGKVYNKYKAEFRMELTFRQLLKFLDNIQQSKLLIKLDRLTVNFRNNRTGILRVDGVISMVKLF
ncbi:MAG: GspMb/PilO family protein [Candidatus Omnitrophota bacterium]